MAITKERISELLSNKGEYTHGFRCTLAIEDVDALCRLALANLETQEWLTDVANRPMPRVSGPEHEWEHGYRKAFGEALVRLKQGGPR